MVCSCAMPSNCVWLQIIFCTCVKETMLISFLRSLLHENGRSLRFPRIFIKKTNSVIEWYNNYWTRLSQNIVICQCLADELFALASAIIDLLTTDKSRYFAQPHPIIVNLLFYFTAQSEWAINQQPYHLQWHTCICCLLLTYYIKMTLKEVLLIFTAICKAFSGCKENHFYNLPFRQAEASIY